MVDNNFSNNGEKNGMISNMAIMGCFKELPMISVILLISNVRVLTVKIKNFRN